jgi:hypothetical protein
VISLPILLLACIGLDPSGGLLDSGGTDTADTGTAPTGGFGGMAFEPVLDLGQIHVDDGPLTGTITLTNESEGNLKLTEVVFDAGADFEASYTSVPWVIGPGGQYVITVEFDPSTVGVQEHELQFGLDGVEGMGSVTVTGEGVTEYTGDGGGADGGADGGGGGSGSLSLSSGSLSFGDVIVGASGTESLTLTNEGSSTLAIRNVVATHVAYSVSGISTPHNLSAGSSITVTVTFTPTEQRTYTEDLNINSDAGSDAVSLTGTGVPSCTICAPIIDVDAGTEMDFVSAFGFADTQTVRVSNIGDEDLIVRNVSVTNESIGAGSFEVSGFSGATTVPAGSSMTFSVSYTCPDALCLDLPNETLDWNILHIESNDPSMPDWTIGLSGI